MRNDFAVFILSHGRADRVKTLKALKKGNYTGKWYIVIDNEDETAQDYYKKYGYDKVIMFDKLKIAKQFDTADNFDERRTIFYARNACFEIAKNIGVRYFLQLDDDYKSFDYRYPEDGKLKVQTAKNLDKLFTCMLDFLNDTGALTVAMAQAGDFIGGAESGTYNKKVLRKAMNTFFCDVNKPFEFVGRINEDVNTYTSLGNKGKLFLTITDASIVQTITQSNKGGMSDVYLDNGTYLKSFYTVMYCPSFVKIGVMNGNKNKRIHHHINWECGVPKILNEKHKKSTKKLNSN